MSTAAVTLRAHAKLTLSLQMTGVRADGFHLLDAPIMRVAAPDVPIPFAPTLESVYRPSAVTIVEALRELIEY